MIDRNGRTRAPVQIKKVPTKRSQRNKGRQNNVNIGHPERVEKLKQMEKDGTLGAYIDECLHELSGT